jgi:hypothetical protein
VVSLPYVRHNCFMYSFSVTVRSKLFIVKSSDYTSVTLRIVDGPSLRNSGGARLFHRLRLLRAEVWRANTYGGYSGQVKYSNVLTGGRREHTISTLHNSCYIQLKIIFKILEYSPGLGQYISLVFSHLYLLMLLRCRVEKFRPLLALLLYLPAVPP